MPISLLDWRPFPGRARRNGDERSIRPDERPEPLPAHVGAWLDRYLWEGPVREVGPRPRGGRRVEESTSKGDKPGRMALLEAAIAALTKNGPAVETWKAGYTEWQRHFVGTTKPSSRLDFIVEAKSRILLHVGSGASVTDGSILLHHTWGIPYLPGSALKGLVRAAMHEGSLRRRFDVDDVLLGDLLGQGPAIAEASDDSSERAAFIDFFDAPWIPPDRWPADFSPLALDVVTPHHNRYYTQSTERPFPTDFDDPVPTHRLSISPTTRFHVVMEADEHFPMKWLECVKAVLLDALEHDGIGAWTTSGYGRLKEVSPTQNRQEGPPSDEAGAPRESPGHPEQTPAP